MPHKNPLVDFLRHYGPIPAQDNMYDELIGRQSNEYGVQAINIPLARLRDLLANFRSPDPVTTVLTGTAGDGKTYHCRRVFEELGGNREVWLRGKKQLSIPLPETDRELVIVKDLSELTEADKARLLPEVCHALRGGNDSRCYLIAANDGQLLATWRRWAAKHPDDEQLFRKIEALLVEDRETREDLPLRIYNLSRGDSGSLFDELIEHIVEHPAWARCTGCPAAAGGGESACPILLSRARLRREASGTWRFRPRLVDLIELASANDIHLPIRHLLILAVNILLGDAKYPRRNEPLLTCYRAQRRAKDGIYKHTNPYANAFGANLDTKKRTQYLAFHALSSFGIGLETENEFDDLLVFGPYEAREDFHRLVESDDHFGDAIYRRERENYLEGDRRDLSDFQRALEAQRQRLFFELDPPPDVAAFNPWRLTVFRHAGDYLAFRRALRDPSQRIDHWAKLLARGLNRTFSGMMIETDSEIYLATGGGDGRARVARFLAREPIAVNQPGYAPYLVFDWPEGRPNPRIAVVRPTRERQTVAEIELRLTHFEYLMRVASGSLPASFSRQCFEEFHGFKLRLLDELVRLDEEFGIPTVTDEGVIHLTALEVNHAGNVNENRVIIQVPSHA